MPIPASFDVAATTGICEICGEVFSTFSRNALVCQKRECRMAKKRRINNTSKLRKRLQRQKIHAH